VIYFYQFVADKNANKAIPNLARCRRRCRRCGGLNKICHKILMKNAARVSKRLSACPSVNNSGNYTFFFSNPYTKFIFLHKTLKKT
jgi:hypothetical protein